VRIDILPEASEDLIAGFQFYERRGRGLGAYFRESLLEDIDLLAVRGGVHAKVFGYHRSLSKRFPFAIYYRVEEDVVRIRAILDCRRNPSWIRRRIGGAQMLTRFSYPLSVIG
jgi:plasmid stabilization system protein ParE